MSTKTAFDIDFLYSMTLKIFHHNATFDGLSAEFNDFFCNGKIIKLLGLFAFLITLDYNPVDAERLKVDAQRIADGWYAYIFLEITQRWVE